MSGRAGEGALIPVPRTRPLVFVGPSASHQDVRALLPEAEIRGPVKRGDLHRARLLRYSVFIVIDGVFAQSEAISPREVVDVVSDGAVFLGASSMGALRAADCAPAGAQGVGAVWRLFRRGVLSSEDEVAVLFLPERPFPALTVALVNARAGLRRLTRRGVLQPDTARRLIRAAIEMHYADRTWPAIFKAAGVELTPTLTAELKGQDIKRADARAVLKHAARCMAQDPEWLQQPRRSRSTFSVLSAGREHALDPLLGADSAATLPGFLVWMIGSGRAPAALRVAGLRHIDLNADLNWLCHLEDAAWSDVGPDVEALKKCAEKLIELLAQTDRLDAERLRHLTVARAARAMHLSGAVPDHKTVISASDTISIFHGGDVTSQMGLDYDTDTQTTQKKMRDCLAFARAWQRTNTRGKTF